MGEVIYLAEAQRRRHQRGEIYVRQQIDGMVDALIAKVELSNADRVGPDARKHLKGILDHYRKMAHPFTACVRDNTKRFGPEGAKKVCAVLTDIEKGTTHWRNGGRKKTAMSLSDSFEQAAALELNDEMYGLLMRIADVDYRSVLGFPEEAS